MAKDNVDERVVQLMLDSKEFDSNAKKSIQSLDDLKKALEFEGSSKGFEAIERAARKVDFSIMDNGIQKVQDHFNLLNTVATTVIERITNSAIDSGTRLVKALSVDQISQGWSQFEDRTIAVQRIMSATSSQFSDQEEQMTAVNEQLQKLIWFTDETSYKYLDMVNNIGKFTANNIDLGKSVKAMEGISTWASLSGASIEEAGRAMYNLSQAMSVGAVKLQDWKSIENANMATFEFKQTAIETAVAMGTLKKGVGDVYDAFGKAYSSAELFSDGLKQGWFTSEVLLETLGKYGGFADELNSFVDQTGILTTTAIHFVDDYVDGTLDMDEAMKVTRMSAEELTTWMEKLGSEENELGRRAFKASQETKTLSEAIDYIKTAVSSGWAKSFEHIFGDYTEAKEWWSEVSEALYEVFVVSGETRNSLLEMWKEFGGRDTFLDAIRTLARNVKGILDSISGAWDNIFGKSPAEQAQDLLNLTERFKGFAEAITFTDGTFQDFLRILESIFRILKSVGRTISTVVRALEPVGRAINKISGILLNMIANLLEFASFKFENFFNDEKLQSFYNTLNLISKVLTVLVIHGLEGLFDLLGKIGAGVSTLYDIFEQYTGGIDVIFWKLTSAVLEFWNAFMAGETFANRILNVIIGVFQGGIGAIILLVKSVYDAFTGQEHVESLLDNYGFMDWIESVKEAFGNLDIEGKLATITEAFALVARYIREFFIDLQNVDSELRKTLGVFGGELQEWYGWLKKIIMEMSAEDIAKVGMLVAITQLIFGMNNLTKASKNFVSAGKGILDTVNIILNQFKDGEVENLMSRLTGLFAKTKILQIGIGITMLVAAFNQLNKMDHATTVRSLVLITTALGVFIAVFKKWDEVSLLARKHRAENPEEGGDVGLLVLEIGAAFLAMSLALSNLSSAFSGVENATDAMNKILPAIFGLATMGAALVGMIAVLKKIDAQDMTQTAGAMLLIATSITMLSVPLTILSKMDFLTMMGGLIGVAGLLVSVGTAMYLMQGVNWKTMLTSAVAFTALAGAIALLSVPIFALGKMGDGLGKGFLSVIGLITALTAALAILGKVCGTISPANILALSAAFISFSASMNLLAIAALMLQAADLGKLAIAVAGFVIVLAGLVAALMAFPGSSVILEQLSKSLMNAGVAMLAAGTGALFLTIAFEAFQAGIVGLGLVATAFGEEFPEILQKGLEATRIIMDGLIDIFLDLAPKIAMAIGTIILAIKAAKWYNQLDSEVVKKVIKIGLLVISAIGTLGGPIIEAITKLIKGLNAGLPDFIAALSELAFYLLQGIGLILRDLVGGIGYMFRAFFTGEMTSYETYQALESGMETAIGYSALGVYQGADGLMHAVEDVYGEAGKAAPGFFNDGQGASSPAKKFIEALLYSAMGVEKGGEDYLVPQAQTTGEIAGKAIVDGFAGTAIPGIMSATDYISGILSEYEGMFENTQGLFTWTPKRKDRYEGLTGAERRRAMEEDWTDDEIARYLGIGKNKKDAEDKANDVGFDFGSAIGDSFAKGTSSGAKVSTEKEKEKTAEEIVNEYIQAIENAYSRGVEKLDIVSSRLQLQDKLWNLMHKEGTTDDEKKAYELAKKEHDIEMLDAQMQNQLLKIAGAQSDYEDKLNVLGSSAIETQKAYNSLLEEQYNILELYSQKQELMSEESESTAEDFIAASKEVQNYRELVEKGLITNEMYMSYAKDRLKAFNGQQKEDLDKYKTDLDSSLEGVLKKLEETGGDFNSAFEGLVHDGLSGAISAMTEDTEELGWSMSNVVANAITQLVDNGSAFTASEGLGVNINDGTISGLEKSKSKFVKAAGNVAEEGIDKMADVFETHSPSKKTEKFGVWLDEGLANGLANDGAVTKVLNAADEIARKLLARLKAKLGVNSPSTETYEIGKWLDVGAANGVRDYADMVMKSSDKMVNNLLSNMKSQVDQNGSEMKEYLKDAFGLTDEDLRFTVIVDADTSLLDTSLTELERANAYRTVGINGQTDISQGAFSVVNASNNDLLSKLNDVETYRAVKLQELYDLVNSYVTDQKSKNFSGEKIASADSGATIVNFTQNNTSPKPISALETYRNTQKQLNMFKSGYSSSVVRKITKSS